MVDDGISFFFFFSKKSKISHFTRSSDDRFIGYEIYAAWGKSCERSLLC